MRTFLLLFLAVGLVNSAIVDSSKSTASKKSEWDDEDSMILPSTTLNPLPSISTNKNDTTTTAVSNTPTESSTDEDQITEEQQRPRFISLIPAGTHKVNMNTIRSKSDQEDQDKFKYHVYPKQNPETTTGPTTDSSGESEQDDSTTPASSSSSSSSDENENSSDRSTDDKDEQSTTEHPRPVFKHIQLGKIPLTYEIIPLLPPREEKQQLLGREDTTPIGFFPPEEEHTRPGEMMMMQKAKDLRREQGIQQNPTTPTSESEEEGEIITGKPVPDLQEIPPEPLSYMVPPRDREQEIPKWRQYPTTTRDLASPQSTINPLLERINDFLMKAKRHSFEGTEPTTTTTEEDHDHNTEQMETSTSAEQMNQNDPTTAENKDTEENTNNNSITDPLTPVSDIPEDSNGDLNPSSAAPIPEEPTSPEEIITTSRGPTILYPRPNIPAEIQDYYPTGQEDYYPGQETQPQLPFSPPQPQQPTTSQAFLRPPSMDQYFSDYSSNINTLQQQEQQQEQQQVQQQQQPLNQYYYTNSNPDSNNILRRRLMISSLLNQLSSTTSPPTPPPPSRSIYIPNDSYWPRKYFNNVNSAPSRSSLNTNVYVAPAPAAASDYNNNNGYNTNYNTNYNYNPFINTRRNYYGNEDYYPQRPQQSQGSSYAFPTTTTSIPLSAALNNILASTSSEEPSYSGYGSSYGGSAGGGADDYSGRSYNVNPSYYSPVRRSSSNDYYSYNPYSTTTSTSTQAPYALSYRPMIPYRPYQYRHMTSSELVNRMMYAPLYPYDDFRRMQVQQQQQQQQPGYY